MRLLFVSHIFPPRGSPLANVGGMQRAASELCESLTRDPRVDLHLLVLRTSWRWALIRVPLFLIRLVWRLPHLAARSQIDVVVFSSLTTALPLVLMAPRLRRHHIRLAAIAHGIDVVTANRVFQMLVRRVLRVLDIVFPVSQATARACLERGMPATAIHVVPNGVDLTRFAVVSTDGHAAPKSNETREGEPPLENTFLLVSVGRQTKRKGFAWFVEHVLPILPPHVHYWLAGHGPEHKNIAAAARRAGVDHRVRLLGLIPEETLIRLYQRGHLFVMPNIEVPGDMEGFGLVMLEANASGLPVLAADLEGIRDVIANGKNGFRVASGDPHAFRDRIEACMNDPVGLAHLARHSAVWVRANFDWDAATHRYIEQLQRLSDVGEARS